MPSLDLTSPLVALGSAALLGFLSGILPTGMAEALAVAIGFVEPAELSLGMYLAFTVASVPPFHLSSIAAGITRIPALRFALICLGGRLVRFGVLAGVPLLIRLWWS